MRKLIATAALLLIAPALGMAQEADHQYHGQGYAVYGAGTVTSAVNQNEPPVQQFGFGGEGFPYKGLGMGGEIAWVHWGPYENRAWLPSVDVSYHVLGNRARARVDPFGLFGASVYVPTEHGNRGDAAKNFGGGVNYWLQRRLALRFEFRTTFNRGIYYFGPGNPYLAFRFGLSFR